MSNLDPVVDINPDPLLHAHEVGGPYRDCPDCIANAAIERGALWRFDVPEVPAHVTALKVDGEVFLRDPETDLWLDEMDAEYSLLDLLAIRSSLVECEDPRAAS